MRFNAERLCVLALLCVAFLAAPAAATTYYVGGDDPGSNWWAGTWGNLNTALAAAVSGDVVRVSGNLTRAADDLAGSISIAKPFVTLSGGWSSSFTGRGWAPGGRLSDELAGYSILDVNGANTAGNRYRVLAIANSASNATVEGFVLTKGYLHDANPDPIVTEGSGILVCAPNVTLRHLSVSDNQCHRSYGASTIFVSNVNARLEYLAVTRNYHSYTDYSFHPPYGGAIRIDPAASEGSLMVANCLVCSNNVSQSGYGSALELRGPVNPVSVRHWTIFGSLVVSNGYTTIGLLGRGNGRANMVNCTVADNGGGIQVSAEGGGGNYEQDNYLINCVVADTAWCNAADAASMMKFKTTLIDPQTAAVGGSFFDGSKYIDLAGNITNTQPLFKDQATGDYRLSDFSPAKGAAAALYSTGGLGFAYVDVDRDVAYDPGADVIVDIVQGAGQYVPSESEYYYPKDINGERWLSSSRYNSDSNLVGKISMGAFAPKSRRGTVITVR